MNSEEPKKMLTDEEISFEISKIQSFFEQIPPEKKSSVAECLIGEIVNWGSYNHYEALGIFEEAQLSYREVSTRIAREEAQEEKDLRDYEAASVSKKRYKCVKDVEHLGISSGEFYEIGFACEDENYTGGRKYIIFNETEDYSWAPICQGVLDNHFELVEE